jgi:hypothetical protein
VDPDPTACLFAGEELKERKPTTTRSQTPLPLVAGHHGGRQQGGEGPAMRSGREIKERGDTGSDATGAKTAEAFCGARSWESLHFGANNSETFCNDVG